MKRRVIVSAAVLVGLFAMAAVLHVLPGQTKTAKNAQQTKLATATTSQTAKGIFSVLGSVSPALTPTVTTGAASSITFSTATLNATAENVGTSPITSRGFEYGLTDSYGTTTTENLTESYDYVSQFGSSPTDGKLNYPQGFAMNSSGDIYVVDTGHANIKKFNSSGVYQSQFGGYGYGDGQFYEPQSIAIDSSDNIYIADSGNHRIQKFNSSGVYQSQFGGSGNGNGQFNLPRGITLDPSGNIYVADTGNHRIQKFNSSGIYQSQFGSSGSFNGEFDAPLGITLDSSGNIYVVDSWNSRIQKFNSSGVYQSQFGGYGSGNGQFNAPQGIAIDSSGNIYVADWGNSRVQKFNSSGVYQSQFGSYGYGDGQFFAPQSIVIDNGGGIYVSDPNRRRIDKFNGSGVYQSQFGDYGDGELQAPYVIAIDSSGNSYVADTNNHRIQKFNNSGVYQSQFGSLGSGNGQFSLPQGIAIDSSGNIYVADTGNSRIQKFNSSGVYQSQLGSNGSGNGQVNNPRGIAIDASDNIYVADTNNHRIQKFNSSGLYQSQFGSPGSDDGLFNAPQGIAIDSSGNIYVADTNNHRIQKFNSSGLYQSQTSTSISSPGGIAVDGLDNLYVANTGYNRIQKFNSSGVYQSQFGSLGSGSGQFNTPQGIAIDSSGNIYVADTSNSRIQKFTGSTHTGAFSADIVDLACNTTYHYRAYATNTDGTMQGDDATFATAACPYPDPPTNLQATILSSTSISLSWDAPINTGDSPIDYYNYGYRLVGANDWITAGTTSSTTATVTGLAPSTEYEFGVSAVNVNGNHDWGVNDVPTSVTATTGTPGLNLISTCQQLQDIQNNLDDNYELARNIDCSDTVNWNGGAGFDPIGDLNSGAFFSGILQGNNYSISDLYINQSGGQYAIVGLFEGAYNAAFQDIRIVRPVISGSAPDAVYAATLVVINQGSENSPPISITNVHVVDAQVTVEASGVVVERSEGQLAGGLVGYSAVGSEASYSRNEFRGTIHVGGNVSSSYVGGLYGLMAGSTVIDDSFARADIEVESTLTGVSEESHAIGGLVGSMQDQDGTSSINHSYASGSISLTTAEPTGTAMIGGLGGAIQDSTIANSFARVAITNPTPAEQQATGGLLGGWMDNQPSSSSNNAFDADVAGTLDCSTPLLDPLSGCNAISGQPNYFYNNTTNSPLNTWDFTNIWNTTSTLPVFDKKVLTSITAIPASRLPGYVPPAGTVFPQASDAPTVGPVVPPKLSLRTFGEKFLPPAENTPTSLIERLKRFFRDVPEVVLVSFPYAFFSLLLIGALALLVEVWLQAKRLSATKLLIARQEAVAKERDTFWHLAANYLRAPVTLMVGGVELLSDENVTGVGKLQASTSKLQSKVGGIMQRIEESKSLQDITRPKAEAPKRVLSLVRFWAPVVAVAVLALAMNYVATEYRQINLGIINLGVQLMIFVLVAMLFYWVLGSLGVVKSKRKQAESLLKRQTASLDSARSAFIAQAATELGQDLAPLEAELDTMSKKTAGAAATATALAIVHEGAHRLRDLINSFQLLVAAQNNELDELSSEDAHSSLASVVEGALEPLQPVIAEKGLTIHTGTMNNMVVPGNSLLLNQVVGSVLANAVAFSPAGSTIELSLKQAKGSVQLVVTNQGTPISKDEISHVFSPLTKADGYDGLQLDHDGLGVNLYIDKLIMEHLGGGIHVASSATKGTTMTMQWPTASGRAG